VSLTFTPDTHVYELDGIRVPSVTGILHASGLIDFSHIPPSILEAARERGTVVHRALHYLNDDDLDLENFYQTFPEYAGYLQAWVTFCAQRRFRPVLCEHQVASRRYQVAGTLDALGTLDDVPVLIDFATGRPQDACKDLQTAAYEGLAREWASEDAALAAFFGKYRYVKRYAVGLRRDGTFRLEAYTAPSDFREFLTLREARRIVESRRGSGVAFAEVA
jgi:hypothetical protein